MFGLGQTVLSRLARKGKIRSIKTLGGHRRYRVRDVREFMASIPSSIDLKVNQELESDAVRLYGEGWSIHRIAREFNMGYTPMRALLLRNNVTLRARGKPGSNGL